MVVGEGLRDGELAVVNIGAAEMTDAVFVPLRQRGEKNATSAFICVILFDSTICFPGGKHICTHL